MALHRTAGTRTRAGHRRPPRGSGGRLFDVGQIQADRRHGRGHRHVRRSLLAQARDQQRQRRSIRPASGSRRAMSTRISAAYRSDAADHPDLLGQARHRDPAGLAVQIRQIQAGPQPQPHPLTGRRRTCPQHQRQRPRTATGHPHRARSRAKHSRSRCRTTRHHDHAHTNRRGPDAARHTRPPPASRHAEATHGSSAVRQRRRAAAPATAAVISNDHHHSTRSTGHTRTSTAATNPQTTPASAPSATASSSGQNTPAPQQSPRPRRRPTTKAATPRPPGVPLRHRRLHDRDRTDRASAEELPPAIATSLHLSRPESKPRDPSTPTSLGRSLDHAPPREDVKRMREVSS